MGHGDDRAGEALQIVLQDGQGGDVQVVGGFVQEQHIGGRHEDAQQVQPPPLAAGQPAHGHVLHRRREQEPLQHLAGGEGALVGAHLGGNVVNQLPDGLVGIQLPGLLGEIADFHRGAGLDAAGIRGQAPGHQVQQGGFPRAVAAHHADAVVPGQAVGEVPQHLLVPEGFADVLQIENLPAQAAGRSSHLHRVVVLGGLLVFQGLVAVDALLALGGAGLAAPDDPLVLVAQDGLALALGGLGHLLPLGLQLQVFGVVGLKIGQGAPAQLGDAGGHPLQEIAVMGDHEDSAGEGPELLLQPGHHVGVQVVGGLVENQHVRRLQQGRRQGHPLALAAGEHPHPGRRVPDAQAAEHGHGLIAVDFPVGGVLAGKHLLQDRPVLLHGRILGQKHHLDVGEPGHDAAVGLLLSRQTPQQGGLARAVDADDADFVSRLQIDACVPDQLLDAVVDGQMFRR